MSNPPKHGHDFVAYERYQAGANLHLGEDLHPGVFLALHPGANTAHEHSFSKDLIHNITRRTICM